MTNRREKKLLKSIQQGDEKSFAVIYDFYVGKIYKFVFFKTSSKEAAEEIVQDVFLKFWQFINQDDKSIVSISALLYRTARNLIIDHYRQQGKYIETPLEEELLQDETDLEKEVDVEYDIKEVIKSLELIPENYQDIIILKFINQMTNREIAEILDKEEGNIRVLAHRALKELKKTIANKDV